MFKVMIGLLAVPVIGIGGYFGTEAYIHHRITSEVEANFEQIRANGGEAKRGDIALSLWHRTVAIDDISVSFAGTQPTRIAVGRFAASGVGLGSTTTFSAESIVITDIEANGALPAFGGIGVSAKAPRFEIADYSGPIRLRGQIKPTSQLDMYREAIAQFATITATSMTAPTMTMTVNATAISGGTDYTYSYLSAHGIKHGKIADTRISRFSFAAKAAQNSQPMQMTGEITDLSMQDVNVAAVGIMLDPAYANDTQLYQLQGPISTGVYTFRSDTEQTRIDGIRMSAIKFQPSKLKLQDILATYAAMAAMSDPSKAGNVIEPIMKYYEGTQIEQIEMYGMSSQKPEGPFKLAKMRGDFDRGKVREFAMEGMESWSTEGPFKVGRFAIKGIDIPSMMRQVSQTTALGTTPSTDDIVGFLKTHEGIELKDMSAFYERRGKTISIETADLSWGQFVGSIPSKARLTLKMTAPIDKDGELFDLLRDAGMDEATANIDIGLAWNENEKKLVLTPGTFEIAKLFAVDAKTSLNNVPRDLFTTNPQQAMMAALPIEYGAIEIVGRDLGAVDLSIAQYARKQDVSTEQARSTLANEIRTKGRAVGNNDPVSGRLADAVAAFIEKPNGTMSVKITPRAKLPVMQFLELTKNDPAAAFSLFDIDIKNKQ